MVQEFTSAPEEFSQPPETAALPEEFPALGTREEPPRRGRSRMKYLLAAGLMLLTAAWSLAPDRPAPTPDTPPDVTLPDGSGGPSEADVAELLDTSWQYENGTVVHFADGVGWWEKDGQLLRFTWEAGADGTGTFGLGSDGSGTQSTYPFTFEMSDLPYAARVRLLSEGDVVFSTGSGTTLTSQSPQLDCALLFTTDGMQLAVIRLFSDGCTMLSPTAK